MSKIYTAEDLVAMTNTPISALGMDTFEASVMAHAEFINNAVSEQLRLFAEETSDSRRLWGGNANFEMKEVDEFGEARSQAPVSGTEVGFPLRKFSVSTGWSNEWYQRKMASELGKALTGVQSAYITRIQNEILASIFGGANYTFKDLHVDNTSVYVKAFLNADGASIPDAPNGDTFDGATHSHYKGTAGASLAVADIDNLITNIVEHGNMRGIALYVSQAMVATLIGLNGKFVKLTLGVLVPSADADATIVRDNVELDPANKLVGYWDGYPVFTRSWVPSGYIACMATGASEKPLVYRVDTMSNLRGLLPVAEFGAPVITAKLWRAYFGFGAWNRASGAVLDTAHQTTYSAPSGLVR